MAGDRLVRYFVVDKSHVFETKSALSASDWNGKHDIIVIGEPGETNVEVRVTQNAFADHDERTIYFTSPDGYTRKAFNIDNDGKIYWS